MTATYHTALKIEQGASKQKIVAAYRAISKELHPDVAPERAAEFSLVTAAFNVLKANPLHVFGDKSDLAWQRDYLAATAPAPKAKGTNDGWVFVEKADESKDDRRKRYARERQAFRYAADPAFAQARKDASKRCTDKKKAAKSQPAAA